MKTEHIIKKDGISIKVEIRSSYYRGYATTEPLEYNIEVFTRAKGKRKWNNIIDTDFYTYRRGSMEERAEFRKQEASKYTTHLEIIKLCEAHWKKLHPIESKVCY